MSTIEWTVVIKRPVNEVFALVANPENTPKWASGSAGAKKITEGPIRAGTKFRSVAKGLGRRMEAETEMTVYEPDKTFVSTVRSGPVPAEIRYIFDKVEEGTALGVTMDWKPGGFFGGFFKVAQPLLDVMARRRFQRDLLHLRDLMERHAL